MAPRVPLPFDRLLGVPADALAALRILPAIAEHTEAMEAHTALLRDVSRALDRVAGDTAALPKLRKEMERVGQATAILEPMDGRMASIEDAMPVLVEVQQHLARLPETMGRLDQRIDNLSGLLERMLGSLDGVAGADEHPQPAARPMARRPQRSRGQGGGHRAPT